MITAWSFSRYNTYAQCPLRARLLYIDKRKEPGSPAMERGNDIHKLAEGYIKGQLPRLPKELALFRTSFTALRAAFRKGAVAVEETWAFRRDWTRTTWDDWNGCWLRVKLDAAHVVGDEVMVIDFKTGKFSPQYNLDQYLEQLDLYALASLLVHPDKTVTPWLHFLDQDVVYPATDQPRVYTPKDLPRLKREWEKKIKPMLNDRKFAPRPSNMCRFCSFRKDNGGPCQY